MSDVKVFRIEKGVANEVAGSAVALERSLQELMERNLEPLLGVRFLASEYGTGPKHRGRIDTLGLDETSSPVIVEYKRAINENVINQGLFYLDWLLDHQAEFKLLVLERLGEQVAATIDWSAPRLLCIAGSFTRYDEHAVTQIDRNIALVRYQRFGADLLTLELVNAVTASEVPARRTGAKASRPKNDSSDPVATPLQDLYEELRAFLRALGDDVQEKPLKHYVTFRRLRNFACVQVSKNAITAWVKVSPDTVTLEPGVTRDVRKKGHLGTGDFEITMRTPPDFVKVRELFVRSYEAS